ncbi:hypothetical protein P5673_033173, partial [Acropora cervicornis]
MSICPRHRDSFGIRWRCKKKFCAVPPSWAPHRARQLRGDRSITFIQSKLIFKMTSTLVPVGSPICRLCRGLLSSPNPMIPEIQIESAVSEESTGESSSKPAPKTTSSSPPGESTENETDDEIISRSDEARSDSLCEAMENVAITSDDTSLYVAKETGPSSSDLSEDSRDTANLFLRRAKLNEFLVASGKAVVAQPKKPWSQMLDARTKQVYIDKAKDAVVAALEVIIPDDAGGLWEALKMSGGVESSLGVPSETNPSDDKYLRSLAVTYENASSWDTRRQVLSIMADLVPYSLLQRYLPGITEYRVKTARQYTVQHGRGSAVLIPKSPRMRVDYA